jgi:hypothetical protein
VGNAIRFALGDKLKTLKNSIALQILKLNAFPESLSYILHPTSYTTCSTHPYQEECSAADNGESQSGTSREPESSNYPDLLGFRV